MLLAFFFNATKKRERERKSNFSFFHWKKISRISKSQFEKLKNRENKFIPQKRSSELSGQSVFPSHRRRRSMHLPLRHRNWFSWHSDDARANYIAHNMRRLVTNRCTKRKSKIILKSWRWKHENKNHNQENQTYRKEMLNSNESLVSDIS